METISNLSDNLTFANLRVLFLRPFSGLSGLFSLIDQPRFIQRHREKLTINFTDCRNEGAGYPNPWEAFDSCPLLQTLAIAVVPDSTGLAPFSVPLVKTLGNDASPHRLSDPGPGSRSLLDHLKAPLSAGEQRPERFGASKQW